MISKCRDNRENADLLEFINLLVLTVNIFVALFGIIEEWIMVVIDIVNADLENALAFVVRVRFDELHANIEMVERLHAEIVLFAIIFDVTSVVIVIWVNRKRYIEV